MANNYFSFKQFTIYQDNAAMKVGTDGVLIGAWAECNNAKRILDVGTGTGLIAIMLAQRNSNALIDAVEIDDKACSDAKLNISNCPWSKRIKLINTNFIDFCKVSSRNYDLIVSNPPFFVNSLKNKDSAKAIARHNHSLSFDELSKGVANIISLSGVFCVIIPYDNKIDFINQAKNNGLFVNKIMEILPTPSKKPKRIMLQFSLFEKNAEYDSLIVEEFGRHKYSQDYINLTKSFYLFQKKG